ncbi:MULTISPECIES: DNA repair protein RecN [unclassified Hwanghaeella]|jgi:DNA repair protein RecN (Recombination protein N)|uniref:DNA repair protein RecN n=1 Tax=unclassified Hwanghaeella TaxID=2605944 RepID=UPI000C91D561|nr:DNA repair protein RecN [Rhodospirillales bacterium]|tara:strand:- start:46389 stop:48062 length:1674 start_codon:yes stop_codon:yes gene_type:complete
MLTSLTIRDIVLIDKLRLSFSSGLSVLTGETGAGKSILLDSLGLALGRRSEAKLVRPGAERASVTAEFDLPPDHAVHALLQENDLPNEDRLLLRRTVSADGRSKAFINDEPVGIALLKQIGERLVEVQGQFDQHGLMDPNTHIDLLDAYGRLTMEREAVARHYTAWQAARKALDRAKAAAEAARQEEDYLRFAADELDKLAPQQGEEEELSENRSMMQNAERLTEAITSAVEYLTGPKGADQGLRQAQRALDRMADKMGEQLNDPLSGLERASVEVAEVIATLNRIGSQLNADSTTLENIEERLFALRDVARKHNVPVDDLARLRDDFFERIALIDAGEEKLADLTEKADRARADYEKAAEILSIKRRAAAEKLDAAVNAELPPLRLERARFTTEIVELEPSRWGAAGRDRTGFTVTTNPGMPGGPLDKIASGGELSRFLLAIKVALAEVGTVPTLVFDEVDAGVGGATAAAVGLRLGRLAERLQVLVVTHSPQVAAKGAAHWRVAKATAEDGRAATSVDSLDPHHRREELARMLSGAEVTDEARAAADRLMEETHP